MRAFCKRRLVSSVTIGGAGVMARSVPSQVVPVRAPPWPTDTRLLEPFHTMLRLSMQARTDEDERSDGKRPADALVAAADAAHALVEASPRTAASRARVVLADAERAGSAEARAAAL